MLQGEPGIGYHHHQKKAPPGPRRVVGLQDGHLWLDDDRPAMEGPTNAEVRFFARRRTAPRRQPRCPRPVRRPDL